MRKIVGACNSPYRIPHLWNALYSTFCEQNNAKGRFGASDSANAGPGEVPTTVNATALSVRADSILVWRPLEVCTLDCTRVRHVDDERRRIGSL